MAQEIKSDHDDTLDNDKSKNNSQFYDMEHLRTFNIMILSIKTPSPTTLNITTLIVVKRNMTTKMRHSAQPPV